MNWFYLKCYDYIIIKTNIFVILLKVGAGWDRSGRVNANTHYRPAWMIEAKVLPRSHPATSTGWVKSVRGGAVRGGSVQNYHPYSRGTICEPMYTLSETSAGDSTITSATAYLVKAEIHPPILVLSTFPLVSYFFHYLVF